jgi:hypothetical protein
MFGSGSLGSSNLSTLHLTHGRSDSPSVSVKIVHPLSGLQIYWLRHVTTTGLYRVTARAWASQGIRAVKVTNHCFVRCFSVHAEFGILKFCHPAVGSIPHISRLWLLRKSAWFEFGMVESEVDIERTSGTVTMVRKIAIEAQILNPPGVSE